MDRNEIVHGSSFDAAKMFCPRCSQREEDEDELTGETERKQPCEFLKKIVILRYFQGILHFIQYQALLSTEKISSMNSMCFFLIAKRASGVMTRTRLRQTNRNGGRFS